MMRLPFVYHDTFAEVSGSAVTGTLPERAGFGLTGKTQICCRKQADIKVDFVNGLAYGFLALTTYVHGTLLMNTVFWLLKRRWLRPDYKWGAFVHQPLDARGSAEHVISGLRGPLKTTSDMNTLIFGARGTPRSTYRQEPRVSNGGFPTVVRGWSGEQIPAPHFNLSCASVYPDVTSSIPL